MSLILYKKEIMLRDGRELIVKEAEEIEAIELIKYVSVIRRESKFLAIDTSGYKINILDVKKYIKACRESDMQALLIGWVQNEIVGHLALRSCIWQRMRHTGEVIISVSKKNWGIGIGPLILDALLDWAQKTKVIKKVKLRVQSDNDRAIAVYNKLGFLKERSIAWGFFDHLVMGRRLD
ncbi:MAG: GNAT family protein [Pseudomonadota bacterium]